MEVSFAHGNHTKSSLRLVCSFNYAISQYGNPTIPVQTRLKLADADFGQLLAPECHHYIFKWVEMETEVEKKSIKKHPCGSRL